MPNLDQAVIVKIQGDVSDFQAKIKAAGGDLDTFGNKAKGAGTNAKGIGDGLGNAATVTQRYAAELKNTYGITDQLSASQVRVIRGLEDQVMATRLAGSELATYTALRKAGVAADSQAGVVIKDLVGAQNAGAVATSSWRNLWGLLGTSVSQTTGTMGASGAAARGLAVEHAAASSATKEFRESVHALHPILAEAGVNVGLLTGFSSAARGGIVALGVAITGTLLVALAKAGDEAITTKKRLDDLISGSGSGAAGKSAFSGLEQDAKKLGVTVGDLAPSMETIIKLMQDQNRIAGVIYAPGSASANAFTGDLAKGQQALISFGNYLRTDIASSTEFGTITSSVFKSVAQAGGLTAQIFEKIQEESPATANAIAKAYRGQDATTFLATLRQIPLPTQQFLDLLVRMGPASQTAFDNAQHGAVTVASELDKVMVAGKELWKSLSVDPGVSSGLKAVADGMDYLREHTDLAKGVVIAIGAGLLLAFGGPVVAVIGAVAGAAVLFANKLEAIWNWINQLITKWNEWLTVGSRSPQPAMPAGAPSSPGDQGIPQQRSYAEPYTGMSAMYNAYRQGQTATGSEVGNSSDFQKFFDNSSYGSSVVGGSAADMAGGADFAGATGTGGIRTVPSGFPNDSYRVNLTEGEQFAVAPAGQSLRSMIASSPIKVGTAGTDRNFATGTGDPMQDPTVDAAITPQGGAIAAMVAKFSDTFSQLGISQLGAKSTISSAGDNKLNDVIRLTSIQIIGAINLSGDKINTSIMRLDTDMVGAISVLASGVQSAAQAAASSSGGSSGNAVPGGGASPGGFSGSAVGVASGPVQGTPGSVFINGQWLRGGPADASTSSGGGVVGGKDTTPPPSGNMALWNKLYGGDYNADGSIKGSNSLVSPPGTNLGAGSSGSTGSYAGPKTDPNYKPPSEKTVSTYGKPVDDLAATLGTYPGVDAFGGSGDVDFAGAAGGVLLPKSGMVPSGNDHDGLDAHVRLNSDEQFRVEPLGTGPGKGGSGGPGITIGTVNIYNPKDGEDVIRSLSQLKEKAARDTAAALVRR